MRLHLCITAAPDAPIFRSTPNARSAIQASRGYAGKPHLAGSVGDFETAERFLALLQDSFNITPPKQKPVFKAGSHESQEATRGIVERKTPSAWIDTYYPVMNTPLERALQIVDDEGNVVWNADLKERAPEGDNKDPDAVKYSDAVPTFHGLSISGDVTGHLIDGNYCTKEVSLQPFIYMYNNSPLCRRTTTGSLQTVVPFMIVINGFC